MNEKELLLIVEKMEAAGETSESISEMVRFASQTQQEDFPADDVEVKEDPSQEDVTVEGEDGASESGDTSSESQETIADKMLKESKMTQEEVLAKKEVEKQEEPVTTTFLSQNNEEVVEEDMTLEQRQDEDKARQEISYDDWLEMQPDKSTSVEIFEGIGNFITDGVSGLGDVLKGAYQMTPFGEGQIDKGGSSAKQRKKQQRQQLDNAYNNWKNQYNVSHVPDNISDQSDVKEYVKQKINNGQLKDKDGNVVKGWSKSGDNYIATQDQIDQHSLDDNIINEYNNKKSRALKNKDKKAIKRLFNVNVSDEFLENYDISKLSPEELKDPKINALLTSLQGLPQENVDVALDEKPKFKPLEEAGINEDIINLVFSGGGNSSIDQDEFKDWYANDSWAQGQSKMRLNSFIGEDGETKYSAKYGSDLGINDKFKATVIQKYLSHKAEKLNNNYQQYKNLGVPELIDEVNAFQNQAESLVEEYTPKYNDLKAMKKKFENGTLPQNEKNVNIYNSLLSDVTALQEKHDVAHNALMKKLTPKNRELLNGFSSLGDEFNDLKATNVRFLENTSFGKEYKALMDKQTSRDEYFEKHGEIGIQESALTIWNKIIDYGAGMVDVVNIPITDVSRKLGDKQAEERALLLHDSMNGVTSEYVKFLTSTKPFVDPETNEINWSRALPSTVGTITDMALMIKGGKVGYRSIKSAGKVAQKGLLKTGLKPVKLEKVGNFYKKGASTVGTGLGSMPVLFPAKLTEALDQVDENFTPEDAYNYALSSAVVEAAIETLNPDWKWTKKSLADIRKVAKDPTKLLEAFKNVNRTAFYESLKSVPPELLEEYLQMFSSGAINLAHNRAFDTDFKSPDFAEAKETLFLTAFSVLGMRGLSGNLTNSNDASLLRVASENYSTFVESLNKGMKDGTISEEKALELKERVDGYTLASADINDMIYDENGDVQMNQSQADRLIELVTTRNALQAQIDQDPLGALNEDLQKELDGVNKSINNERNTVKSEYDAHKVYQNNITIKEIQDKLKEPELTEGGKKELQKELSKLQKENKDLEANTPEYQVAGKAYDNKADFLKAIRAAKYNGSLKRGKNLNIKVKNDLEAEKEAYKELGTYAPKDAKGRIVMTNKQALDAESFIDKRTELELRTELKKELLKSKQQQNKSKIQQYKDALKYLDLKKANYQFGKPGFLVKPTIMSQNELMDLQLENNIEGVRAATEQFGGDLEVLTNDQALDKYGAQVQGANGFFVPKYDNDGNVVGFSQVINKDVAKYFKARSVASHEMLHGILFSVINGPMRQIKDPQGGLVWVKMSKKGRKLIEGFLDILPQDQIDILNDKLDQGGYRFAEYDANGVGVPGTELAFEEYAEEYLNMYHDAVVNDESIPVDMKENKGIVRRIIDFFNNIFNGQVPELTNTNIQDPQDLFEFLGSYNKQAVEGKFNEDVVELGKKSIQTQRDVILVDAKNKAFQKALAADQAGDITMSRSQKPLNLEAKSDLFSKTNEELSMSLQAYGLEGEFDPNNEEHLDIWNSIPKQEKLFIGYSIGNLWKSYAQNKLFVQYGNTPNFKDYESDILDVLTTGIEVGQNGLPYIVSTWDPTQRKLTSHIWDLLPTRIPHVTRLPQFAGFGKSLDEQFEDEVNQKVDDTPSKVNVLKFEKVRDKTNEIRNIVKVKKGDTFKEVSDNYTGRVAQTIFGVPQAKITDPKKNLTYAKKIVNGIPESSEAGNIQDFYRVGNNAEKLIKILPKESVSSQDADINEVGENIDVSRDVYGRGLGLSNRTLKYFYNKTNRRSKGLSSQPYIWELKPEFRNPSQETVDKLKEDLGITPKGELNNYDRNIGQLLKGVAKFQGQQTALSTAQRILEPTIAELKQEQAQEVKQQLANIRSGQSNLAFSRNMKKVDQMMGMYSEFDLGINGKDVLLKDNKLPITLKIKSVDDIPAYIDMLKRDVFPLLPKEAFFGPGKGTAFTSSSAIFGLESLKDPETGKSIKVKDKNGKLKSVPDPLWVEIQAALQELKNDNSIVYGDPIPGVNSVEMWSLRNKYDKLFKSPEKIKNNKKEIIEFNDQVGKIHKALWDRINKSIKDTEGKSATGIATYLGVVANDTGHWHKLGAQFAGYSTEITGKRYEYEHAMPATAAYLYLLQSAINPDINFDVAYELVTDNYKLIALDKAMDDKLRNARTGSGYSLQRRMPDNWSVLNNNWWERYFNDIVNNIENGIDPNSIVDLDGVTFSKKYGIKPVPTKLGIKNNKRVSDAIKRSRTVNPAKGITVLDFDDTLATSKSLVISTSPEGVVRKLTAEEFAQEGADLLDQGWVHDFSEFSKVVDGKVASLFNKAMKLQGKFGPENMFVLTARPADSAPAIFEFLKANGLNIPLENITGLANSTSEAKALWIADKVGEGYNDFYFADDALQNVQAVQNMLDQFDVKSKVQQAKLQFSKSINTKFNDILESTTGVESIKEFSDAQARLRGQKTKYKSIIPASAQDFQGLLYNFLGKGKKGEADMAFFKKALIDPFARGINELNASRQSAANDFENLNKKFPDVKKKLNDNIEGLDYTNDQAMRVYLWNKAGFEVPGLSKRDLAALTSFIENNPEMKAYADAIGLISKKEDGYSQPKDYWLAENITSDLLSDGAIGDKRSDFLAEWIQNKDMIFSKENLNKIEAIYGSKFREALEDMLYRMETGRNRPTGNSRLVNGYMNWVNNSVGAIMFLNLRSATLQTISATNYINWTDNNPLRAGMAFANQKQFWSDFSMIWNSPYLKQRRAGNQRGINEAELSAAVAGSDNKAKAAIAWLLKKGFTPTQIADSFAISIGGASMLRNRIKTYIKEGMSQKDAEAKAWLDFQETTEVNQQSARPDMISQQQASPLGRLILAFQNTPMQYARIMNKATRDLANGRGDYKAHISKIAYYGVVQSIIFGALQSALYASLGDDDEENFDKKKERILNQMVDSWLTGIGVGGKAVSTVKNTLMEYFEQRDKGFNSDHAYTLLTILSFSPPIGSKLRKIYSSIQTEQFNRGVFSKRGFTLDNPIWSGVGNVIEGVTNIPLGRMSNLMLQLDNAMDPAHKWWQRVALLLGQNTWDLGIKDPDIEAAKDEVKKEKKIESKKRAKVKKEQKKKEKEEESKVVIKENKKKSKKDGICSAVSKGGKRCKTKVVEGKLFCTVHESTTKRSDGKEVQCRKRKSDGKRCKMKTTNKSGYCYYHD